MQFKTPYKINNNNNNNSNEYYKNFRHEFGIFSKEKQFNSFLNKSNYKFLNKTINNNNYLNNSNKNYNKIYQNENFLTRNLIKFQIFKNSKNF